MSPGPCERCHQPILDEDDYHSDDSGEHHQACFDEWFKEEGAYWRPIYDREKRAGLIPKRGDDSDRI